jgi:sugar phosphate isomerase/epimerase
MKIGVRLESLGAGGFRPALAAASRLGVQGVQFDAVGELHPDRLGITARRDIAHLLRSHGLAATALHCPLRHGLGHPTGLDARIEHLKKAMTLSFDLGARIVIVDAGRTPEADDDPRRAPLREILLALAMHGDRVGATLALEAGADPADRLTPLLDSFPGRSLAVNFDPANFILHDLDPLAQLTLLRDRVVHVHAHDARAGTSSRTASTTVVGGGDTDWLAVLATLTAFEYPGFLVVEHDEPDSKAVAEGVKFLCRLV